MKKYWRNQLQSSFQLFVSTIYGLCLGQIIVIHRFNHQPLRLPLPNSSFSIDCFCFAFELRIFWWFLFLFFIHFMQFFSFFHFVVASLAFRFIQMPNTPSQPFSYTENCAMYIITFCKWKRKKKKHFYVRAPTTWYKH